MSNNNVGIAAYDSAAAKVWASGNAVSGNGYGFLNSSALFESAGDNAVRDNDFNSSGTITVVSRM